MLMKGMAVEAVDGAVAGCDQRGRAEGLQVALVDASDVGSRLVRHEPPIHNVGIHGLLRDRIGNRFESRPGPVRILGEDGEFDGSPPVGFQEFSPGAHGDSARPVGTVNLESLPVFVRDGNDEVESVFQDSEVERCDVGGDHDRRVVGVNARLACQFGGPRNVGKAANVRKHHGAHRGHNRHDAQRHEGT